MLPANGIGLSPDEKTRLCRRDADGARLVVFEIARARDRSRLVEPIYRGENGQACLAGLGGYRCLTRWRWKPIGQYLRRDAGDQGLHFGDRAGRQAGRSKFRPATARRPTSRSAALT
jgi:hypothetical protein